MATLMADLASADVTTPNRLDFGGLGRYRAITKA